MKEAKLKKLGEQAKKDRAEAFDKEIEELRHAHSVCDVSIKLHHPNGLFLKRCPDCGKRLKVRTLKSGKIYEFTKIKLYLCDCGYEYGIRKVSCGFL